MRTKLFCSQAVSLLYALEEINDQIAKTNENFDLLILSIHPDYDYNDVNYLIENTLQCNNYVAFHAMDSFYNDKIVEKAVNCLAIKFENRGSASIFYIQDIENRRSLEDTANYLNNNTDKFHIVIGGLSGNRFCFFLEELSAKLNYHPVNNIIGGISSGTEKNGELLTYQFVDNKVIKNGFVIISFENTKI